MMSQLEKYARDFCQECHEPKTEDLERLARRSKCKMCRGEYQRVLRLQMERQREIERDPRRAHRRDVRRKRPL